MKNVEAAATGTIVGCLYGVVLWAGLDTLSTASVILYGDPYYIPINVAAFIAVFSLAGILSYPLWVKQAQNVIVVLATADYDELEEDELE